MAATTVHADGTTETVPAFKVGTFKSDGTEKCYAEPKVIQRFSIDAISQFPLVLAVFLHLAEADSGGFGDFVNEMYAAIQADVVRIIVEASMAMGAAYGATIGTLGGPIGTVVGAIVGAALCIIINWLVGSLKDDIFESRATAIQIPSSRVNFNGSDSSPVATLSFVGHNGRYDVSYDWNLRR